MGAHSAEECWTTSHPIDPHVWVGGYLAAASPAHVRARGVTHVLKLFADDPSYPGGRARHAGVEYLVVGAEDAPDYPLHRHFPACLSFLRDAVGRGGKVLIHCHAGVSRAPTIAVLYLMVLRGLPLADAWRRVKSARPMARPNPGFQALLVGVAARRSRRPSGRPPRGA